MNLHLSETPKTGFLATRPIYSLFFRAKKIQNKATINESPTDRLIRELKEENARLLAMLKKQGGGDTTGRIVILIILTNLYGFWLSVLICNLEIRSKSFLFKSKNTKWGMGWGFCWLVCLI